MTKQELNQPDATSLEEYCQKNEFATHPDNPLKKPEFNWVFKQREHNGFSKAFVKINSRNFLVHIPTYTQCLAERRGA